VASEYARDLQRRHPEAHWLGWVDTAEFFSRMDVLVVPSLWPEPFGRVVTEAASAGVPVLVSRRGGLLEAAGVGEGDVGVFEPTLEDLLEAMRNPSLTRAPALVGTGIVAVVTEVLDEWSRRGVTSAQ
jgi:glycosyltransferase involved in cell wall biosynthesis